MTRLQVHRVYDDGFPSYLDVVSVGGRIIRRVTQAEIMAALNGEIEMFETQSWDHDEKFQYQLTHANLVDFDSGV